MCFLSIPAYLYHYCNLFIMCGQFSFTGFVLWPLLSVMLMFFCCWSLLHHSFLLNCHIQPIKHQINSLGLSLSLKHSYLDRETSLILRNIAGKPSHLLTKVTPHSLLHALPLLLHAIFLSPFIGLCMRKWACMLFHLLRQESWPAGMHVDFFPPLSFVISFSVVMQRVQCVAAVCWYIIPKLYRDCDTTWFPHAVSQNSYFLGTLALPVYCATPV